MSYTFQTNVNLCAMHWGLIFLHYIVQKKKDILSTTQNLSLYELQAQFSSILFHMT